jgi:hypothetical protein
MWRPKFRRHRHPGASVSQRCIFAAGGLSFVDGRPMLCFVTLMPVSSRNPFGSFALTSAAA